jgi:hypothetical protein
MAWKRDCKRAEQQIPHAPNRGEFGMTDRREMRKADPSVHLPAAGRLGMTHRKRAEQQIPHPPRDGGIRDDMIIAS